jgi:hypothetical protein
MNDFEIFVSLASMVILWGGTIFVLAFNPFGLEKRLRTRILGYDNDEYWDNVHKYGVIYAEQQLGSKSIISPSMLKDDS